jgi:hypothetical protein
MQQAMLLRLSRPSSLLLIGPHPRQGTLLLQPGQSLDRVPSSQMSARHQAGRQQMHGSQHSQQASQQLQTRKSRSRTLVPLSQRQLSAHLQRRTQSHRRR